MVVDVEHPLGGVVKVPGNPIKFSDTDADAFSPPPLLGVHTKEVFSTWTSMSDEKIANGIEAGAIA